MLEVGAVTLLTLAVFIQQCVHYSLQVASNSSDRVYDTVRTLYTIATCNVSGDHTTFLNNQGTQLLSAYKMLRIFTNIGLTFTAAILST